jgi:hypothetical protein
MFVYYCLLSSKFIREFLYELADLERGGARHLGQHPNGAVGLGDPRLDIGRVQIGEGGLQGLVEQRPHADALLLITILAAVPICSLSALRPLDERPHLLPGHDTINALFLTRATASHKRLISGCQVN